MAGIKVCLIEKGRRWEANDFPKDTFGLISAMRIESRRWGFSFGSKKALYQIHDQGESLAAVACGLGGGSLVNAGVMAKTPERAKRDPKWPKEWHQDWEMFEQAASTMLGSQRIPVDFPKDRIMKQMVEEIEEYQPRPMELGINFGSQGSATGSCLACGNCLSGCPYGAKNSTDKNYLATAIQDGCTVKTERRVLFILENPDLDSEEYTDGRRGRRWRVYFDDLEYIGADFVVLSAGVLGTTEILLQSKRRGLSLSDKLGHGLSCNGNNVAYLAGSEAPLHAHGLAKKQILDIPFQSRPGPAISASYTSSLGFTIQSCAVPKTFPSLLFKGITTYGWPTGTWLLHGLIDTLKIFAGLKASQGMVLNVVGHDACNGTITLDDETESINITAPYDTLLPKKVQALQKLTRKLGGILFMSRYRSTCVHLLGGCNAASDPSHGVCNQKGQIFNPNDNQLTVHEGLYICDASVIPCSVGINPCLTISTVAEHISAHIVQDIVRFKSTIQQFRSAEQTLDLEFSNGYKKSTDQNHDVKTGDIITVHETMSGFIGGMPCAAYLLLKMNSGDRQNCTEKDGIIGGPHPYLKGRAIGGYVIFKAVSKDKLFVVDGNVDMCKVDSKTPYTRIMHYRLILAASSGSRYILEAKKIMSPYMLATCALDALSGSTTLHVRLRSYGNSNEEAVNLRGELRISVFEVLRSLVRLEGRLRYKYVCILLLSLWRTYILQTPMPEQDALGIGNIAETPYPPSILHELTTEDDHIISCRQWKRDIRNSNKDRHLCPVLLLNGHSESYCLPTEKTDLVRTLLEEGYETWLLQSRLHPSHTSNDFTIEDIGRFDIPAAIAKIIESTDPSTKIHVIAHCIGGLAIHIALLGSHISASHIASLSCTNSSMYFKLTTSAVVRMQLPLIPIFMKILGKNRTLSLYTSKNGRRHQLVKCMARLIPRNQRCTLNACEVSSGIFGNTFWHENVSNTMHNWLNEQSILPMPAFPHLRRICTTGFIVDAGGENKYLIHPERMALPTLYVSGERSLLVTPETSLLANRYMRLHQPEFHHRRVIVDDFGHSDLLIGEESYEKVFPHFISHMKLAEEEPRKEVSESQKDAAVAWNGSHDGLGRMAAWGLFVDLFVIACVIAISSFLFR